MFFFVPRRNLFINHRAPGSRSDDKRRDRTWFYYIYGSAGSGGPVGAKPGVTSHLVYDGKSGRALKSEMVKW